MKHQGLRSLIAITAASVALLALACGDDNPAGPPPPVDATDTTQPHPVSSLVLTYDSDLDAVLFRWLAPRDDDAHERVDHYEIRYTRAFPFDWAQAESAADPPAPLQPGSMQEFTLARPATAVDMYGSIRAVDAAGNVSPVGTVAHVRVPGFLVQISCVDALSGAPIAGLDAVIQTGAGQDIMTTDAAGALGVVEFNGGTLGVALTNGSATTPYHVFHGSFTISDDTSLKIPMIPFQQPQSTLYVSILALLKAGLFSPGGGHVVRRWHTYPVAFYAQDFVNTDSLDYHALLQQGADRWNTRLGFQMFAATDADPSTGILVEFLPRSAMGTVTAITEYSQDANGYPAHDRIRIVDDLADGERVYDIFMHELGHTIPLVHLPAGFIMQGSSPLPGDITDDEVVMVKLLLALPNGTDLDDYDPTPPVP
jgi:hypothetical protein